jgi:hypothetical protein
LSVIWRTGIQPTYREHFVPNCELILGQSEPTNPCGRVAYSDSRLARGSHMPSLTAPWPDRLGYPSAGIQHPCWSNHAKGGAAEQLAAALEVHQDLRLTRLACGKVEMPCPPECARMGQPLPEPPGSCPSQARGAARSSRPLGGVTETPIRVDLPMPMKRPSLGDERWRSNCRDQTYSTRP